MDDSWIQTIIGGAIGFGAGVFTDPVKSLFFHPTIEFESGTFLGCLVETKEFLISSDGSMSRNPHDAMYYRIRLINKGKAIGRSTRLYLTGIETSDLRGNWGSTGFADTLMLPWSCRGAKKFDSLDLPRGVPHFADLMSTREPQPSTLRMEVDGWPLRYAMMLPAGGVYRLTILATGDNFNPVSTRVTFPWNGGWKDLRMVHREEEFRDEEKRRDAAKVK